MTVTTPQPRTTIHTPRMTHTDTASWDRLTEAVREVGQYGTAEEAESVTRTVLTALTAHVSGDERAALAGLLPQDAHLLAQPVPAGPLTAREFVESLTPHIAGATPTTTRWHVTSALTALSHHLTPPQVTRLLTQLPPGYALLFGRADLAAAA